MDNKVLRTRLIVFLILTLLTCCCISTVGILSQIEGNPISELYQRHLNPVLIPVQTAVAPPTRIPLILEPDDPKAGMPAEIGNLFDPFWESWELLHENFVDQPLDDQRLMAGAIAGMRETMQPIVPYQPAPTGEAIPLPTPTPELIVPTRVPGSNLFDPFWAAWQELHAQNANLDDLKLMRGAIQGMLAATGDKHTSYMDPDQFAQANSEMEGEYEGIGAWVDITGEYVQIVSPMRGSPAERRSARQGYCDRSRWRRYDRNSRRPGA